MSTFDYAATADTARGLLERFGRPTTLTRMLAGAYNPATGSNTAAVPVSTSITAAVLPIKDEWAAGQLVRTTKKRAYIAATGLVSVPKVGDVMAWPSGDMRVTDVKTLAPAGTAVLYTATVEA